MFRFYRLRIFRNSDTESKRERERMKQSALDREFFTWHFLESGLRLVRQRMGYAHAKIELNGLFVCRELATLTHTQAVRDSLSLSLLLPNPRPHFRIKFDPRVRSTSITVVDLCWPHIGSSSSKRGALCCFLEREEKRLSLSPSSVKVLFTPKWNWGHFGGRAIGGRTGGKRIERQQHHHLHLAKRKREK